MFSFFALTDSKFVLNDWKISSQNECYRLDRVFKAYPYRDNKQLLVTNWNTDSFIITYCGNYNDDVTLFSTKPGIERCLAKRNQNIIYRSTDDIGFKYQIDWQYIQNLIGRDKLINLLNTTISRQQLTSREFFIPAQPYFLYLSNSTLYFHDVEEAFIIFIDTLLSSNWKILETKNVILCPSMVPPETTYLPLLTTIDWLCFYHNINLFITTLDKNQFKYLHHAKFIDVCENFIHRARVADYSDLPVLNQYPYFMAWDSSWHPEMKGMELVLRLFKKHNIKDKLYIKIPEGYPNKTLESDIFYEYVNEYQETVDIELVSISDKRNELLKAIYQNVAIFVYACHMDGGPRIVFELAGMNKKILFYDKNDCNIIKLGLLDKYKGFATFNEENLAERCRELSEEKHPDIVHFFDTHNWKKTRNILRAATKDPNIKGFWFECCLVLDQD